MGPDRILDQLDATIKFVDHIDRHRRRLLGRSLPYDAVYALLPIEPVVYYA